MKFKLNQNTIGKRDSLRSIDERKLSILSRQNPGTQIKLNMNSNADLGTKNDLDNEIEIVKFKSININFIYFQIKKG